MLQAITHGMNIGVNYWKALFGYLNEFNSMLDVAQSCFCDQISQRNPEPEDYAGLFGISMEITNEAIGGAINSAGDFHRKQLGKFWTAWLNTIFPGSGGEDIFGYLQRIEKIMHTVANDYPQAIKDIKGKYGLHFDNGNYRMVAETERFELWRVLPLGGCLSDDRRKPLLVIPPYVLGPNILSFLPGENKSFLHCFANAGFPTYIRIVKDIAKNEAVQNLTGEIDCLDTAQFCKTIKRIHRQKITLCGYCQGGFTAVINLLSGKLDSFVDALLTCVAPMDGSKSVGLQGYLNKLPAEFLRLVYATKKLPNGNTVIDGKIMSLLYKLKSLGSENPVAVLYRDLGMFDRPYEKIKIGTTAAAINHWLRYDIRDLPCGIVDLSHLSYTIPVTRDGTLPVRLFGKTLNFNRIKHRGIKWMICASENDDLVEKESALAPLEWVPAEVTIFPKGHVAIATSWSLPTSECSLDSCFNDQRGPVRWQLEL